MPVLDYASPGVKSRFRMGTRSVLRMSRSDSELRIVESLEDHREAIGAMIFSAITVGMVVAVGCSLIRDLPETLLMIIPSAILAIGWLVTALAVIDSNWRRTILEITPRRITLRMISPLRRTRTHEWPAENLRSMQLLHRGIGDRGTTFAELEFSFFRENVRLFSGHRADEIAEILRAIREELAREISVEAFNEDAHE